MQQWFLYALIAAVFIGVKDLMTKDLTNRYSYIEYIIIFLELKLYIYVVFFLLFPLLCNQSYLLYSASCLKKRKINLHPKKLNHYLSCNFLRFLKIY